MNAGIPERVLSLVKAMEAFYAARPSSADAVGREVWNVRALLQSLPPLSEEFPRNNHAVTRVLPAVLRLGNKETASLLRAIKPVGAYLPWRYSYPSRADAPELAKNIAFAELVGPGAPWRSDSVCLGLTLIAPQTLYPAHRHPAVELYGVLAGTASWILEGTIHDYAPGSFILHPSQAVHAMQTHAETLLALYSWSGNDVRTSSNYTDSIRNH